MSKMCNLNGCSAHRGLCTHEKLMMVMVSVGVVFGVARWGLHLL
jgi:hypothetical protein